MNAILQCVAKAVIVVAAACVPLTSTAKTQPEAEPSVDQNRALRLSQAAIGETLGGLDYSTVSRERKRLREKAERNK